jgi:hypothetical protein
METDRQKSFLFGISSFALSFIALLISFFLLFLFSHLFGELVGYISYNIVIVTACYFICRNNPSGIWYVPVICNIAGIISAIVEPNFWITPMWILICSGWALSIIASLAGALGGRVTPISKNP